MSAPRRAAACAAVLAVGWCLMVAAAGSALAAQPNSFAPVPTRLPGVTAPSLYPAAPSDPRVANDSASTQYPKVTELGAPSAIEVLPLPANEPAPFDSDDLLVVPCFPPTVPSRWFAGAEFLLVRPVLSDAIAFLSGVRDPITSQVTGTLTSFVDNYEPSARGVFGYRIPETSSGVQFTYWHFAGSTKADFTSTQADTGFIANAYLPFGPLAAAGGPGASIDTALRLRLDVYDLDYFKSFLTADDQWYCSGSIGVRAANFGQRSSMLAVDDTGSLVLDQTIGLGFTGAGPRLALEGRRNIGSNAALYVRGGYGMLLGKRGSHVNTAPTGSTPALDVDGRSIRAATVGDLELGAAWRPLEHWILSVGWILQGWTSLNGFQQSLNLANNGNILALDGLSVRAAVIW